MAGATAATAAGVGASEASTITIDLVNNYISYQGQTHLNADLTGDGQPDLTIANIRNTYGYYAFVSLNGVRAYFRFYDTGAPDYLTAFMGLGSRRASWYRYPGGTRGTQTLIGSIPVFFKDLHINGGVLTKGSLEVAVMPTSVVLDSLTYKTSVSDQGSSIALLAMGAVGVLAFRRLKVVQKRS